eukprot:104302_1
MNYKLNNLIMILCLILTPSYANCFTTNADCIAFNQCRSNCRLGITPLNLRWVNLEWCYNECLMYCYPCWEICGEPDGPLRRTLLGIQPICIRSPVPPPTPQPTGPTKTPTPPPSPSKPPTCHTCSKDPTNNPTPKPTPQPTRKPTI